MYTDLSRAVDLSFRHPDGETLSRGVLHGEGLHRAEAFRADVVVFVSGGRGGGGRGLVLLVLASLRRGFLFTQRPQRREIHPSQRRSVNRKTTPFHSLLSISKWNHNNSGQDLAKRGNGAYHQIVKEFENTTPHKKICVDLDTK